MSIVRWTTALAVVLACGFLSGCCTIIKWPSQTVEVTTTPPGAKYKLEQLVAIISKEAPEGRILLSEGTTPASLSLHRNDCFFLLTLSQEGRETTEVPIEIAGTSGWIWLNLLVGGIVGIIVDAATGSAILLEPEEVNVTLTPVGSKGAVGAGPAPGA
jgi:hypothetical protein